MPNDETIRRLLKAEGKTRIYEMADGSLQERSGGSVAWRNNNPGNLKFGYAGSADPTVHTKRTEAQALASAQAHYQGVVALDPYGNAIFGSYGRRPCRQAPIADAAARRPDRAGDAQGICRGRLQRPRQPRRLCRNHLCLFRPWPERGEIVALTGHLAENELHGGLSFIERALGVAKVRELYEAETGKPLSQSELARRLRADGYPVPQPHISRMQEAIQYLLPAIPNVLYAGLGCHQVEQLTALRRWAGGVWETRCAGQAAIDFPTLFQDVLAGFDDAPSQFAVPQVKDELLGRMADQLGVNYDTLAFEVDDREQRWQVLNAGPVPAPAGEPAAASPRNPPAAPPQPAAPRLAADTATPAKEPRRQAGPEDPVDEADARLRGHIVTPAASTDRLQAIQRLVAEHADEDAAPDFAGNVVRAIPVQAGGLHPIADVWYIEPALDDPGRLRRHIGQLALEIAGEADLGEGAVVTSEAGIGFACAPDPSADAATASARALLALLDGLSAPCLRRRGTGCAGTVPGRWPSSGRCCWAARRQGCRRRSASAMPGW